MNWYSRIEGILLLYEIIQKHLNYDAEVVSCISCLCWLSGERLRIGAFIGSTTICCWSSMADVVAVHQQGGQPQFNGQPMDSLNVWNRFAYSWPQAAVCGGKRSAKETVSLASRRQNRNCKDESSVVHIFHDWSWPSLHWSSCIPVSCIYSCSSDSSEQCVPRVKPLRQSVYRRSESRRVEQCCQLAFAQLCALQLTGFTGRRINDARLIIQVHWCLRLDQTSPCQGKKGSQWYWGITRIMVLASLFPPPVASIFLLNLNHFAWLPACLMTHFSGFFWFWSWKSDSRSKRMSWNDDGEMEESLDRWMQENGSSSTLGVPTRAAISETEEETAAEPRSQTHRNFCWQTQVTFQWSTGTNSKDVMIDICV